MTLVSVVTPAFMAEQFIEDTIASVRAQAHRPLEHIVVDDLSPDGTAAIVERLAQETAEEGYTLRLSQHEQNLGTAAALNNGIDASRGEYVAWLSADDMYVEPGKTTEQLAMLHRHPEAIGAFDSRSREGATVASSKVIPAVWPRLMRASPRLRSLEPRATLLGLMLANPINGTSVLLRRSTMMSAGRFDPALGVFDQDGDLWLRYSALGWRMLPRDAAGTLYRTHEAQNSRDADAMEHGTSLSRLRMLLALAEDDQLGRFLSENQNILDLVAVSGLHRWRPVVGAALVELAPQGLPWRARSALRWIGTDLRRSGKWPADRLDPWLAEARGMLDTAEYRQFRARLAAL